MNRRAPGHSSLIAHLRRVDRLRLNVVLSATAALVLMIGAAWYPLGVEPAVQPSSVGPQAAGELLVKFKPGTAGDAVRNLHTSIGAQEIEALRGIGVSRVRVPNGSSAAEIARRYQQNPNVQYAEPNFLATTQDIVNDPA